MGTQKSFRLPQTAPDLREAMIRTHQNIFANGIYDLATPFFAAEYTANHLNLLKLNDNIEFTYYDAGHMMYFIDLLMPS